MCVITTNNQRTLFVEGTTILRVSLWTEAVLVQVLSPYRHSELDPNVVDESYHTSFKILTSTYYVYTGKGPTVANRLCGVMGDPNVGRPVIPRDN